jgi:hypothetical protein
MANRSVLHWIFFAVLFCLLPLPFQVMEAGFAPALRIVLVAGILAVITVADGFSEITRIMLPLIAVQAALTLVLLVFSSFDIYVTPVSSTGRHSSLVDLLD